MCLYDHPHPSVRYLARTQLAHEPAAALTELRAAIATSPPARAILAAQYPAGFWMHPDHGIAPRYRATAWQLLYLAQLGVGLTPVLTRACEHLLAHNRDDSGAFRLRRERQGRSALLSGALLWAYWQLGYRDPAPCAATWAWLEREGALADADTATLVWVVRAAAVWQQTALLAPLRARLAAQLTEIAPLPLALTFPVFDQPDLLSTLEALVESLPGAPLPKPWRAWLQSKQGPTDDWPLEKVPGKLWATPGAVAEPNPWVTLRALRVLRQSPAPAPAA